jgi:tRNA-Thr(GGU) m(6)t(6)A37 methyltransferase TsaA
MQQRKISVKPIGVIHSPYKESKGIPIQGRFKKDVTATAEIFPEYCDGLKDLDGFSHAFFVYHFHLSDREKLISTPYLEDEQRGIFSIRSPHRPNHIGVSIVKIEKIKDNIITFRGVDVLDGTPLLDIKPYVSYFDSRENVKNGWLEKHFKSGKIPERTQLP